MSKYDAEIKKIKDSGLFDTNWYLHEYPDIEPLDIDPIEHYLWVGARLKRNPSPTFETSYYIETYPDIAETGINPLLHYINVGKAAGYATTPKDEKVSKTAMQTTISRKEYVANKDGVNVLIVLPGNVSSSSGYQAYYFARQFAAKGINCIIAVPDNESVDEDFFDNSLCPILCFKDVIEKKCCLYDNKGPDIVYAWTTREIVRKFCIKLKEYYSFKIIIHIEENEEYLTEMKVGKKWNELVSLDKEQLDKIIPNECHHPIHGVNLLKKACGLTMMVDTLEKFNIGKVPSLIIKPVIDERLFYPRPINWELRREMNISDNHTVIGYAGNITSANCKDVEELYKAILLLNKKGYSTTLIRTGRNEIHVDWIDQKDNAFVKELGWVDRYELPDILSMANIFVQPGKPSAYNDMRIPYKLPEFFAIGRPVILPETNIGLKVRNLKEGYVLRKADAENISKCVIKITKNKDLVGELSSWGVCFSKNKFQNISEKEMALFYEELLEL